MQHRLLSLLEVNIVDWWLTACLKNRQPQKEENTAYNLKFAVSI